MGNVVSLTDAGVRIRAEVALCRLQTAITIIPVASFIVRLPVALTITSPYAGSFNAIVT